MPFYVASFPCLLSGSSGGEVFGPVTATFLGTIQRQATSKVLCVRTDVIGRHLVVMVMELHRHMHNALYMPPNMATFNKVVTMLLQPCYYTKR